MAENAVEPIYLMFSLHLRPWKDLADVVTDFVTVETFVFGSYAGVTLSVQMQRLAELQTECAKEPSN